MSKHTEFETILEKQNRQIKFLTLIILPVFITINIYWMYHSRYYAFRASQVFNDTNLNLDVCVEGTKRILNKIPETLLITDELLNYLKGNKFSDFNLEGFDKKDFLRAELINNDECKLVFKEFDGFQDTLVSLKILLKKDSSFPFEYKVANYSELILARDEITQIKKEEEK